MAQLTARQVAAYAYKAGWRGQNLEIAVAVAYAESTFYDNEQGRANPNVYGLWQVDKSHLPPGTNPTALFNPATNAYYAIRVYWGPRGWDSWQTYTQGTYKQYMAMAKKAAAPYLAATGHTVTTYHSERVQVNIGNRLQPIPAIVVPGRGSYVAWTVLKLLGIPYTNQGGGVFVITGTGGKHTTLKGVIYKGTTYLYWGDIPGLTNPVKISGGFRFTGTKFAIGAALGVVLYFLTS